ncbi:Isopentenyl-diphosphate Delta-isomerase [Candidatus Bealeia paramacronuclearis]|uniref:Isopentenyl-diphosphate Delta-isomerase n=1 Tax=Candidatus Bealeia paramacronuclearis TaxID=1921001 RepID=A0ABZ2C308_9PROT|nr:Isopentenyl-diphosphate Delta-isomerase [Candidatus Bealeia paramacronuclearis]
MLKESEERVILVDENDQEIGTEGKFEAHLNPRRHRAFSIFIFNPQGEILIQRRALCKYHAQGLWANTCCGHPRPQENVSLAAQRRLHEELGFGAPLTFLQTVKYDLKLDERMWEKEFTHVFQGVYEGSFELNPDEIMETRWIDPLKLKTEMESHPQNFAAWFLFYVHNYFEALFLPKIDLEIKKCG